MKRRPRPARHGHSSLSCLVGPGRERNEYQLVCWRSRRAPQQRAHIVENAGDGEVAKEDEDGVNEDISLAVLEGKSDGRHEVGVGQSSSGRLVKHTGEVARGPGDSVGPGSCAPSFWFGSLWRSCRFDEFCAGSGQGGGQRPLRRRRRRLGIHSVGAGHHSGSRADASLMAEGGLLLLRCGSREAKVLFLFLRRKTVAACKPVGEFRHESPNTVGSRPKESS